MNTSPIRLSHHVEHWALRQPFRIAGKVFTNCDAFIVELEQDGNMGRGESFGVFYLDQESPADHGKRLEAIREHIESGLNRQALEELLPPGGARNALDCALWDLEAKTTRRSIWELTGIEPKELLTAYTIAIDDTATQMGDAAAAAAHYPLLKVKLDHHQPVERLQAIRAARPDARLLVDANQSWSFAQLQEIVTTCADLGVEMIEQPLPRGADAELEKFNSPVTLCADESCLHLGEFELAAARYQMINIKLDKTGGLTHALKLASVAQDRGIPFMVGCMPGTSLALAPAFVLACEANYVDIDAATILANDRHHGLHYGDGRVKPFTRDLWG